jgi:hypothetical protein
MEHWVPGTVASTSLSVVSLDSTGDHLTTAVETGLIGCSYGLVVTSASDPIVVADDLLGSGIFYSTTNPGSFCAANHAPTFGWFKVSAADLHKAGVSVPPFG